jgi:hypothetical protein
MIRSAMLGFGAGAGSLLARGVWILVDDAYFRDPNASDCGLNQFAGWISIFLSPVAGVVGALAFWGCSSLYRTARERHTRSLFERNRQDHVENGETA